MMDDKMFMAYTRLRNGGSSFLEITAMGWFPKAVWFEAHYQKYFK